MLSILARVLVWGLLFAVLYLLRSFFLLIFLTFVFAYIQVNGVNRLAPHINSRNVRVVTVAILFLGVVLLTGVYIVPRVKLQGELFAKQFGTYVEQADNKLISLAADYPILKDLVPELQQGGIDEGIEPHKRRRSPTSSLLQQTFGLGQEGEGKANVRAVVDWIGSVGGKLLAIGSAFLLSLLFSFLIVLDLPRLSAGLQSLRHTKVGFIYEEVADSVCSFSGSLGKALEAQLVIALLNTVLTAIGIVLLGLGDKVALLSMIVFLCSFIPVAGVFISSVPICLMALQSIGFTGVLLAILLITVVHMVEAYILNPRIYGAHLKMNPVIVLIILTVAGKLFHFWGLVLGVPLCNYIFSHAIRYKDDMPPPAHSGAEAVVRQTL